MVKNKRHFHAAELWTKVFRGEFRSDLEAVVNDNSFNSD